MQYIIDDRHVEDIRAACDAGVCDFVVYESHPCKPRQEPTGVILRDDLGRVCEPLKGLHVQSLRFFKIGRDFIPHAEVIPSMFGGAA